MSQARAPIVTTASVEVFFTSMLRLLSEVFGSILRFGWQGRSVRLHRMLCRVERAVECLLFLKAVALHPTPARKRRAPRFAPLGFRRVTSKGRLLFRSARIRARKANALERALALIEALMHPARAVHHFLKRIGRGLASSHLLAAAPPSDALAREAVRCVSQLVDTS
ncbi:MAG: hypothetical protein KA153_07405 [Hyphomonadaceae bacterium]|nr:hypothetical protein [Hyphomonadaceae bacterium]